MRIFQRYMVLSYIGPFLMTFFISVFVLFMQFLWKYVDDLIGKGLETSTLAELFFYAALTTFPLALPLSILLSSLMTFGNLGEQYELVALKSAGMSLRKIMSPLILLAFLTSVGAFFFSNNFLPYINLKMSSLIYDIQQKKPALNIKEGVFYNGIDGYTIRINKQESDGITCRSIMIYDHTKGVGNNIVITADSGKLMLTADKQFLNIVLYHGSRFEEAIDEKNKAVYPLIRSEFAEQTVRLDLSGFRLVRTDEELFKSNYSILNIKQIDQTIDSLRIDKENRAATFKKDFSDMLSEDTILKQRTQISDSILQLTNAMGQHFSSALPGKRNITARSEKQRSLDYALNKARSKKYFIESLLNEAAIYDRPIVLLSVEWHKKFTLSLACLILFFIGAPLGAIIRKGGLGMPVVASVIIFILFWVITITGEKMSKEEIFPPYIGMWIATAVTLPAGIFLTSKATSDSALLDSDSYQKIFQKILWKKK